MTKVTYTYEDNLISDLYKDAYGYRPDQWWMMLWSGQTPGWKQMEWDRLCDVMNESIEMEKQMEKVSLDEFKKTLRATMKTTGTNWKRALSFLAQAEDIDIEANSQEFSHFLWRHGIGYEDRNKICKLYEETV